MTEYPTEVTVLIQKLVDIENDEYRNSSERFLATELLWLWDKVRPCTNPQKDVNSEVGKNR